MIFKDKKIDFLAIGDTGIDAFIKLKDAEVHCNVRHEDCELCVRYGDKIPYELSKVVAGIGNSPNAAVSASRLGLKTALIAHIGDDSYGKDVINALKAEKISTDLINVCKGIKTNYHYVLWYESERTILIKHEKFDYNFKSPKNNPSWVYLSSLGDHTENYHDQIADYIEKNSEIKLAFQPGTFQMKLGIEKLSRLYKRTEVFICNTEEAERILGIESEEKTTDFIKSLLVKMANLGPKIVLITDGPMGAYAYENGKFYFMSPYPDIATPYERTGAGDAFASTFVSALALGKDVKEALMWAPINSMSVVQKIGAQEGLLNQDQINAYLKKAPKDYFPKEI